MVEVDASIEDANADAGPCEPSLMRVGLRRVRGADPADAGRNGLGRDTDRAILDDEPHVRAALERACCLLRAMEHEAAEGLVEDQPRLAARLLGDLRRDRTGVHSLVEGDDPAAFGGTVGDGRACGKDRRRQECCRQNNEREDGDAATHLDPSLVPRSPECRAAALRGSIG